MRICVIGTGYVGLVVGTGLAETGNKVICVDKDEEKIKKLENNIIPIYEPGLEELVRRNQKENRLSFTTSVKDAVSNSEIIYIAVGTPEEDGGTVNLSYVFSVAEEIGDAMENGHKIIVNKSTVPVGTARKVKKIIKKKTKAKFDVISNPEFLKEGTAVQDFMKPDRIIIGTDSSQVAEKIKDLYEPFVRTGNPILVMKIESAEMAKYASNTMLACRISFMNEIANLCDKVGADVEEVRIGMGKDPRIGSKFLFPGIGYGGSCFPKDVKGLIQKGKEYGLQMKICESVDMVNQAQKKLIFEKIKERFKQLKGIKIAIWGLSFKPQTDDMREAASIVTINLLLSEGVNIKAFDPKACENARELFKDRIEYGDTPYDCLRGAEALVILTEWNEFRNPDFEKISQLMNKKIIFDGRNIYDPARVKESGFEYYCIGRDKSR
ncbi:UDP-glucose/GDP-mannose dehydrogenase family protein [candidate division WOR-3 bacterium]|nr:UDP-glucose/GDP-mannose dehydrogenase family protein [candidate division WOR-3 bacterium]